MPPLQLFLFGTPRLEFEGNPIKLERRKSMALAAYLALAEQKLNRDVVAGLLWPQLDDDRARSALRSTLYTLTTPFPFEWIEADRTMLMLKPDNIWVDVRTFIASIEQVNLHGHGSDELCDTCVELHKQALELYQADFLSGFYLQDSAEYNDWQLFQSQWLRRELMGILRRLAKHEANTKQFDHAIEYTRRWLTLDELHEPAHRLLMELLAVIGQRSEALRQYERCVYLLDHELATVPEEITTQLYHAIQENKFLKPPPATEHQPPLVCVLPPIPSLVIGRESALADIQLAIGQHDEDISNTFVIQGLPGVGKSTLMALLAHNLEITRRYPDGVLWTSLGESPDLYSEITVWAEALGLYKVSRPTKIEDISTQIRAVLREKKVLLLVDDVWQAEHVTPFRVGGLGCTLIVTSRLNDVAAEIAPAAQHVYRLALLTEDAGLKLLTKLAPEIVASYPQETRALIQDLEGLPLAIHIAGRLLQTEARLGWGISELMAELRDGARLLQAHPPRDMTDFRSSPTVSALLKRSTDLLDTETRSAFALLGLFVPKPATFDLGAMAALWNVDDPRPTARILVNRGLLEPISGGRFQMHALLVLHARSLLPLVSPQ